MRNINLRYVDETYDEKGVLKTYSVHYPETFNFAYDIVDDIAVNDPDRRAMVWRNPEGEEHVFTFADMKRWSDKTANFLASLGLGRGDFVMVILRTTSSGSRRSRSQSSGALWCRRPSC